MQSSSNRQLSDQAPLVVTNVAVSSLKPYPNNARIHPKAQIQRVADSIREFGFTNPVLIAKNHTIIAGHGRVEAAKLLGLESVPTICLENLTPPQVRAYILADNKLSESSSWNKELLKIELQNLSLETDFDLTVTGFEVAEIDLILGSQDSANEDPDDQLPESQGEPVARTGDIWLLGKHRVLCGDSRSRDSYRVLMDGRKASVGFTDPPYNVSIPGHASGNGRMKHRNFTMGCGELSCEEFTEFLRVALQQMAANSSAGAVHFVCMDFRHMGELLAAGSNTYDALLNVCVWAKDQAGMGSFYRSQHEMVFVFRKGGGKHLNNIQLGEFGRNRTNLWQYPATRQHQTDEGNLLALHPTVKPVALIADAILDCSKRGDLVLDGFLGSGSTLIAAERTGRVCYGIEIDPKYVDVVVRRWQRYTGEEARHIATCRTFSELEKERSSHE